MTYRIMLGQGCLRALCLDVWRTILLYFHCKWVYNGFCQWVGMGAKVPLFTHKTHFLPGLRGVEIFSKKGPEAVPTQHNYRNHIR